MKTIALVSPVKNELKNLPFLIDAVEAQSVPISLWIFVNDASTDGTGEYLQTRIKTLKNVACSFVVSPVGLSQEYALGTKYSQVVNYGFEQLRLFQKEKKTSFDFIGILDADCRLEPDYYRTLLTKFERLPKLGIASGVLFYIRKDRKIFDRGPRRWARGGFRLWRRECFESAGYIMGMSADALSSANAWLHGWEIQSFLDAQVESREPGTNYNGEYYGKAAYYRYVPLYFVIFKCLFYVLTGRHRMGTKYIRCYLSAAKEKKRNQINDDRIVRYFRYVPLRIFCENVVVIKNSIKLYLHGK